MKVSILIISLLLLGGWQSKNEKPNSNESSNTKIVPLNNDDSILPDKLSFFLKKEMLNWKLVSKAQWLEEGYVESYNHNDAIVEKIAYESNIFVKGDFNGDKREDYVCFLIDNKNNVVLWAFHQTEIEFEKIKISDEGSIEKCCVGAGVSIQEPALIENPFYDETGTYDNGIKKIDLKHKGIIYSIYEKTARLYYFDGEAYNSFLLSD
ncbi:MAG: hypothetical protein IIA88_01300 [Bacteroidetes bacterium]|nr:hypothetical protein [Bacteroidota bacterium]